MVNPSPVPPYFLVVDESACENGAKIGLPFFLVDSDPGVGYGKVQDAIRRVAALHLHLYGDLALLCEFDRVAHQVHNHLPQPRRISTHDLGYLWRHLTQQLQAFFVRAYRHGF
jgi:hypothetical protein